MKSALFTEAKAEIIAQVSKELLDHLVPILPTVVFLSVNRVAGMLEISPDTVKRLFRGRVVVMSARQHRIALADVIETAATYRKNKPRKKKKTP